MAPKCILPERNHCHHPTAIAVDCPIDSRQWSLDDRETDSDESSEVMFDVLLASSFGSTVGLLHAPPGFDKEVSVHLAWRFLIEGSDYSLCDASMAAANILKCPASRPADDAKETEMKSSQIH